MKYLSTRDASLRKSAAEAIVMGLARDGGLYTPVEFPALPQGALVELMNMTYPQRAAYVMKLYLDEFTEEELGNFTEKGYACPEKFDTDAVAPVVTLNENTSVLELWHGPTCAFKDMALQMLPYLLSASLKKTGEDKTVCILVATSGDTGKAALEGFKDVEQTRILVFYPENGVSDIQKLQMTSQEGANTHVFAIKGNFDNAQTGVKQIFNDDEFAAKLAERNIRLSSANSINIGRLVPQVAYYVYGYVKLVQRGVIKAGDKINIVVPTGNFGNILAAYLAAEMGIPVNKFICASNENNVLTEFLMTGIYDIRRDFYVTNSPSMDILISSNLERLLYLLSGRDGEAVKGWMEQLEKDKVYEVSDSVKEGLQRFWGGFCNERETETAVGSMYRDNGYLMDTHTAVAYEVYMEYLMSTGDHTPTLIASTASPYKFAESVGRAIGLPEAEDGFAAVRALNEKTGVYVQKGLKDLDKKPVLHTGVCEVGGQAEAVLDALK